MSAPCFSHDAYCLIDRIGKKLRSRRFFLCAAESCTGGLISSLCTEVAGSSEWFAGGVIAYSNDLKVKLLGVDPKVLDAHGAVSREVVEAMAAGALDALDAQCSLAVSGIAGPGGGTAQKPVGMVWIAAAVHGGEVRAECFHFPGDRAAVRLAAVSAALGMVEDMVK